MTIAAKITPNELGEQARARFVDQYFVVKLLNASGLAYTPGLQDPLQYVIDYELPVANGYLPQVFGYVDGDVFEYADDGVGLRQKQAIFQHDGGPTGYTYDNVAVQWATGVVIDVAVDLSRTPGPLADGDYVNIPVSSVTGNGSGLATNFTVFNGAIVEITVNSRGFNYTDTDELEISSATFASIGAHDGNGGSQGILLTNVYDAANSGGVLMIAPTNGPVTLTSGNESAIYFNYKNFGYYNTST